MEINDNDNEEKSYFWRAMYFPVVLLVLIWIIKFIELFAGESFGTLGIYPREVDSLKGIIFSPLLHADFKHLINNSVPFFLLTLAIFYFYRTVAFRVIAIIWLLSGICVWLGARSAYHIGASSLIYGEAAFLFFSGVMRMNIKLLAISLLVTFLYGGMVWGILPFDYSVSFESHLFGGLSGMALAYVFSKKSPKDEKPKAEEDDDEEDDEFPYWNVVDSEDEEKSPSTDSKTTNY